MNIDISNLAEENHSYAIHLACLQDVITYNHGSYKIADTSNRTPFEIIDFWRNLSLATEILLKACLLKHGALFFKKRAHGEYGEKVTANSNSRLQEMLNELKIDYVAQINTGTISNALKHAENKLFNSLPLAME
jgi:hypothetical protein